MEKLKLLLIILLIIGMGDAIYESYLYFQPKALVCPDTGIIDCSDVITSQYSILFGVPLAILGLSWFIVSIIISFYDKLNRSMFPLIWYMGGFLGFLYSIISQGIIGKICIYCTLLDAVIILTIIVMFFNRKKLIKSG